MPYTIGACGFGATGSSAVTDYLKEYTDNVVLDGLEFTLPYISDGLQDLRYHLQEGSVKDTGCKVALERFRRLYHGYGTRQIQQFSKGNFIKLSEQYFDSIVQASWITRPSPVLNPFKCRAVRLFRRIKAFGLIDNIEKKLGHEISVFPLIRGYFSANPEDFEEKTRNYVRSVLDAMGRDPGKNLVLDQPFAGNNPQAAFDFFDNPKAIVVDRDPRDLYLFTKVMLNKKGFRQFPVYDVKEFVKIHRAEREGMPYRFGDDRVLVIYFEDLIYKYDETTAKINEFCGINSSSRSRKLFAPELSINNTQVFKRYPQYKDDIAYIEKELSEYLYPFEKFGEQSINGKMFNGCSPLNKR